MGLAHEKKSYLQEKANLFEIGSSYNQNRYFHSFKNLSTNNIITEDKLP